MKKLIASLAAFLVAVFVFFLWTAHQADDTYSRLSILRTPAEAAPTFEPSSASGPYTTISHETVTLTAVSGGTTICYSTDGKEPSSTQSCTAGLPYETKETTR